MAGHDDPVVYLHRAVGGAQLYSRVGKGLDALDRRGEVQLARGEPRENFVDVVDAKFAVNERVGERGKCLTSRP